MRQAAVPHGYIVAVLVATLMLASCGPSPSPIASPVTSPTAPSVVDPPSLEPASPTPTAVPMLEIDALPSASLDPATQTAVCDPEARQAIIDAGEATINCDDSLVLGLRALTTVVRAPIERLYFRRPVCQATPCTDDELSTAIVTGWTAEDAFSVALDSRLTVVGMPMSDTSVVWPVAGTSLAPAVERPVVKGAPGEVARRTPYPFCGRAEVGKPPSVLECFRDAVLAGRPAEALERVYETEGGEITWLYRFNGRGMILRYSDESGQWLRQAGLIYLGTTPATWDFDPWWGTDKRF